jgi:hypothetical protein
MWSIPLIEIVATIGDRELQKDPNSIAAKLNSDIRQHAYELRSFKQAYSAEVRGIIDLVGYTAVDIMASLSPVPQTSIAEMTDIQRRNYANQFKNLFAIVLEKDKARKELRTMHILASLHAALRWNNGQQIDDNDLFDFEHAAAALAYSNAFFTDRPLCDMVTKSHLALDILYGCRVTADIDEAISVVSELVMQS